MENQAELIEPVDVDMVDFTRTGSKDNEQSSEKFFYTINAPKSFRAHSDYTFNLTIHDVEGELDEAVVVRVSIEDEDDEAGLNIHQDVTMKPNVTQTASLAVGDVSLDSNYKLVVKGVSGITLEREASLDLQQQIHAILIQTDKAIYKPMDCIKFRVLVLDSQLKAAIVAKNELNVSFIVRFLSIFVGSFFLIVCFISFFVVIFCSYKFILLYDRTGFMSQYTESLEWCQYN